MKTIKFIGEFVIVAGVFFILGAVGALERGGTVEQTITTVAIGMIMSLIGFMAMGIAILNKR